MARQADQADKLYKEAEIENAKTSCCFGNSEHKEKAAKLYGEAADKFKMSKQFGRAAEVYTQCAECLGALENIIEEGDQFNSAAQCYATDADDSEHSPEEKERRIQSALDSYDSAAELYKNADRKSAAAQAYENIAQLNEKMLEQTAPESTELRKSLVDAAAAAWKESGVLLKDSNQEIKAMEFRLKVAYLVSSYREDEYPKAIEVFEDAGKNCVVPGKSSDAFFAASLCHLAECMARNPEHLPDVRRNIEQYKGECPTFEKSREHDLLQRSLDALEHKNMDQLNDVHAKYNKVKSLTKWQETMFCRMTESAKLALSEAVDLEAESSAINSGIEVSLN